MNSHIVLHPDLSFDQVNAELAALGWMREPDTAVAPPVLPGEPLVAAWRHPKNGTGVSYTFNPVVFLRTLRLDGDDSTMRDLSGAIESRVPSLNEAMLHELLQSGDEAQLLLGVLAARTMKAVGALDRLGDLVRSAQGRVAAAARSVHDEILLHLVEVGVTRLNQEKQRHPERSVLFPRLGDAHMRRQTLRWLIRDYRESNEHIDEVLRSGLVDEDWEVGASAMLAAVRLNASTVGADVKQMALPRTSREGPDEIDRSILYELGKFALAYLAGEHVEIGDGGDEHAILRRQLWRCMVGQAVERRDRIFLFINALTEPLEVEDDAPPALECVEEHDSSYRLRHTGIELCWVAALPHWLGTDDIDLIVKNPIRRVAPAKGFFIARRPLSVSQARNLGVSDIAPEVRGTDDELYWADRAEAMRLCESLGRLEGAHIGLPEADEWEMAARGTDGRRYPWGNGFEKDARERSSPWGLDQTVGYRLQWTTTKKEANVGIVCGGETDLRCSSRHEVLLNDAASLFAVRPVVRPGSTVG